MFYFLEAMRPSDVSQVQEIDRRSFSTPWASTTYLREMGQPDECRYVVARAARTPPRPEDDEPRRSLLQVLLPSLFAVPEPTSPYPVVGYGGVSLNVDEGHITTIATAPEVRGCGIGELLLNGLIDNAVDLGATALTLEVRISNTVAQNLYHKYGFSVHGTRRRYYTDNSEDALIMWTEAIGMIQYKALLREHRLALAERLRVQQARDA